MSVPSAAPAPAQPPSEIHFIQLNPQIAEFRGPFDRPVRSQHKVKNIGQSRLVIKIKVSESELLRARPTSSFLEIGQEIALCFQNLPFAYNSSETYDRRKFGIFYANAHATATDANVCAKAVTPTEWKNLKVSIRYVLDVPAAGDQQKVPPIKTVEGQTQPGATS